METITELEERTLDEFTSADIQKLANPAIHKNLNRVFKRAECHGIAVFKSLDGSLTFIGYGDKPAFRFSLSDLKNPACLLGGEVNPKRPIGVWQK